MKESKLRATAVVTMTVSVLLEQPWGGEATLDEIHRSAVDEATERLSRLRAELGKQSVTVGDVTKIRIVLNEELR